VPGHPPSFLSLSSVAPLCVGRLSRENIKSFLKEIKYNVRA
jgi:hypothetical protein